MSSLPPSVKKLLDQWREDSKFDMLELGKELARVPQLHADYLELHTTERFILKQLELDMDTLALRKNEHYAKGPTPDTKDWPYPASGKILPPQVKDWISADPDIQELKRKIELQQAKLDALQAILDTIKFRSNTINAMIKYEIWKSGDA